MTPVTHYTKYVLKGQLLRCRPSMPLLDGVPALHRVLEVPSWNLCVRV